MAPENNRDRKENQKKVGDDVATCHGDELNISLPTPAPRVWEYLPIIMERLTFDEIRYEDSDECGN